MSKVDLSVFDCFVRDDVSMEEVIYSLADGDLDYIETPESDIDPEVAGWDAYREGNKKLFKEWAKEYDYEHLDTDGGGEGGAEHCWGVFRFKGKIYQASWSYYSHHGYDYGCIESTVKEVKPVQKTVTVYE